MVAFGTQCARRLVVRMENGQHGKDEALRYFTSFVEVLPGAAGERRKR